MKRGSLVILSQLLMLAPLALAGQEPPATWVPLTATSRIEVYVANPQGNAVIEMTGTYARDSHGDSYQEHQLVNSKTGLRELGPAKGATLFDRVHQVIYLISPSEKTVRKRAPEANDRRAQPLTREGFDQARKGEKSLGKKVISGIECEGFQTPVQFSAKHFNETWYAPSLNFLVLKTIVYASKEQKSQTLLKDIRVGAEPDPSLFRLPEGLREAEP